MAQDPPLYKENEVKFPTHLLLQKAPDTCVGKTGLYNHFEFLRQLLKISAGNPSVWTVKELLWEQDSLSRHHATGVQKDWGKPVAKAKAASSKAVNADDDMRCFDSPFLAPAAVAHAARAKGSREAAADSDCESDKFSDGFGTDFSADMADVPASPHHGSSSEAEVVPGERASHGERARGSADPPPEGGRAPRADEGVARGGQIKTVATDFSVVRRALGSRPLSLFFSALTLRCSVRHFSLAKGWVCRSRIY